MTFTTTLLFVLLGLVALNIMVLLHELGHYVAARIFCIDIEVLQLGFGPEVKRFGKGATKFSIAAIPFGGVCKMDTLSLYNISAWKRIIVYLAGPLFNALASVVCFTLYLLLIKTDILNALTMSLKQCHYEVQMFQNAIVLLISGKAKLSEILSGTFLASKNIGSLTYQGFSSGFYAGLCMLLYLFASVSLSLGVANLLPIPALDGGFILISLIELITRKTFSERFYLVIQIIGLVLLLAILPVARILY